MTDEELIAEVSAFHLAGSRGEVEELEGTPAGTYLSTLSPSLPVFNASEISVGFSPEIRISYAFTEPNPTRWTGDTVSMSAGELGAVANPA